MNTAVGQAGKASWRRRHGPSLKGCVRVKTGREEKKAFPREEINSMVFVRKNVYSWEWLVCKTQGLVILNRFNNWYSKGPHSPQVLATHWRTGSQGPSL